MITTRLSDERGRANFGWLDSRHTFSFGDYRDAEHMGFGPLRVINEDRVQPAQGFGTHGHRDMEILSYVLEGALEHKDSIGTGSVIRPHDVQIMSAGTGIRHSEFNPSPTEPVHFLQIWIIPDREGIAPRYAQKTFAAAEKRGRLLLVGSSDGRDGSVVIHQDVELMASILGNGDEVTRRFEPGRNGWVQVVHGAIIVNGIQLAAGDGAAIENESELAFRATQDGSELLLFDLP